MSRPIADLVSGGEALEHVGVLEDAGRVDPLIDRSDEGERPEPRIFHALEACRDEALREDHVERAPVERAARRVDFGGDAERVVPAGDRFGRPDDVARLEQRPDLGRGVELRERRAEPLAVRRVLALDEEAQAHQISRES